MCEHFTTCVYINLNRSPISCHIYCCSLRTKGKVAFIYFFDCKGTTHSSDNRHTNQLCRKKFMCSKNIRVKYEVLVVEHFELYSVQEIHYFAFNWIQNLKKKIERNNLLNEAIKRKKKEKKHESFKKIEKKIEI